MKIKNHYIKCDSCGWMNRCSLLSTFRNYKKPCPACGAKYLIDGDDLVQFISMIFVLVFLVGPIDWALKRLGYTKTKSIRVSKKFGEYTVESLEE